MTHTLEGHKLFPYVAWGLVLGFVLFTYSLTIKLTEASNLHNAVVKTQNTVTAINDGV